MPFLSCDLALVILAAVKAVCHRRWNSFLGGEESHIYSALVLQACHSIISDPLGLPGVATPLTHHAHRRAPEIADGEMGCGLRCVCNGESKVYPLE